MSKLFIIYFIVVNLAAFGLMGIDKSNAKSGAWRIPERTLFLPVLLGGGVGGCLGMRVFRHKTKHMLFIAGFPAITVFEIAVFALLYIMYHT